MGHHSSSPGDVNTSGTGQNIGEIRLVQLYIKDDTTTTATPAAVVPTAAAPTTNPCQANVTDLTLTSAQVMAEYPGFQWDPTKAWTAQEMQCWAWLSLQSGQAHPDRPFSQQYGFEPYLLI